MILVEVVRGNFVESRHQVCAVIVNEHGQVVKEFGDSQLVTSPRSAVKMLQALPLVESGAADKYQLLPQQISLACASHSGENEHLRYLDMWMKKTGIEESWLHCGAHPPYHEETARRWIREDRKSSRKVNNCSGKHLGMMTTSMVLNEEPKDYWRYESDRQKKLRRLFTEISDFDFEKASWGVDGCGIPTYAMPLVKMAKAMSFLIQPNKVSKDLQKACGTIMSAVAQHPFFVSGSGEFTTETIEKSHGQCLIKVGAEGVYCGVLPEKGLAFALKCIDGQSRASEPATAWLLDQMMGYKGYQPDPIKNWSGDVVGQVRVSSL